MYDFQFVRTKENVDESLKKRKEKKRRKKGFKSHIAQDKHLNSVSLPIYSELIYSVFLVPVEKHFLNFSFSLPYFSRCISGKLLPLSFWRSKILVAVKSDFLSHIFSVGFKSDFLSHILRLPFRVTFQVIFSGGFRVTFQVIQEGVILEKVPSVQWESYTVIWAVLSWGRRGW